MSTRVELVTCLCAHRMTGRESVRKASEQRVYSAGLVGEWTMQVRKMSLQPLLY